MFISTFTVYIDWVYLHFYIVKKSDFESNIHTHRSGNLLITVTFNY